jgi:putative membrane protein
MRVVAMILVSVVALAHVFFLVLEMFLWTTPFGRKTFRRTEEQQKDSAVLAANQGLYNGFLAAGLVYGMVLGFPDGRGILLFILSCVVVAGLYGAATASRNILFVQAIPGIAALAAVLAA